MGGYLKVHQTFRLPACTGLTLFLADRLGQQTQVHLVSHCLHMPVLLGAQQIARAADLHIPHGDFKSCAEFREFPDGLQPLGGNVGEYLAPHKGEVGEGAAADRPTLPRS